MYKLLINIFLAILLFVSPSHAKQHVESFYKANLINNNSVNANGVAIYGYYKPVHGDKLYYPIDTNQESLDIETLHSIKITLEDSMNDIVLDSNVRIHRIIPLACVKIQSTSNDYYNNVIISDLTTYDPEELGERIPIVLVHGWHLFQNNVINMIAKHPELESWENLRSFISNNSPNKYKIFQYRYPSFLDISTNGAFLSEAIKSDPELMNRKDIIIIGHSMGGLVAKSAMFESNLNEQTLKLLTLATPHHGIVGIDAKGDPGATYTMLFELTKAGLSKVIDVVPVKRKNPVKALLTKKVFAFLMENFNDFIADRFNDYYLSTNGVCNLAYDGKWYQESMPIYQQLQAFKLFALNLKTKPEFKNIKTLETKLDFIFDSIDKNQIYNGHYDTNVWLASINNQYRREMYQKIIFYGSRLAGIDESQVNENLLFSIIGTGLKIESGLDNDGIVPVQSSFFLPSGVKFSTAIAVDGIDKHSGTYSIENNTNLNYRYFYDFDHLQMINDIDQDETNSNTNELEYKLFHQIMNDLSDIQNTIDDTIFIKPEESIRVIGTLIHSVVQQGKSIKLKGKVESSNGNLTKVTAVVSFPDGKTKDDSSLSSSNINSPTFDLSNFSFNTSIFNQYGIYRISIWAKSSSVQNPDYPLVTFQIQVVKDNEPPEILYFRTDNASYNLNDSIELKWEISDSNEIGYQKVNLYHSDKFIKTIFSSRSDSIHISMQDRKATWNIPGDILPGDEYYFIIEVEDNSELKNYSLRKSKFFSIIKPQKQYNPINKPSKAINVLPSNRSKNVNIYTDIQWKSGGDTTSYYVYFDDDYNLNSADFRLETSDTRYKPPYLKKNTTYYWRIDAVNSDGITKGETCFFTTEKEQLLKSYVWDFEFHKEYNWKKAIGTIGTTFTNFWQIRPSDTNSKCGILSPDDLNENDFQMYNEIEVRAAHVGEFKNTIDVYLLNNNKIQSSLTLTYISGDKKANSQCIYKGNIETSKIFDQINIVFSQKSSDKRVFIDYVRLNQSEDNNDQDTQRPYLTFSNPPDGKTLIYGKKVEITYSATDNIGISHFQIDFCNDKNSCQYKNIDNRVPSSQNRYLWIPDQITEGGRLRISVFDSANNAMRRSHEIKIIKDPEQDNDGSCLEVPELNEFKDKISNGKYGVSWKSIKCATKYEIKETINGSNKIYYTDKSYYSFNKKESGLYYYKVRAIKGDFISDWSYPIDIIVEFVANKPPDSPLPVSPKHEQHDIPFNNTLFQWISDDPDSYMGAKFKILLGTSQNQMQVLRDFDDEYSMDTTYIHKNNLDSNTKYYWQVFSKDIEGDITTGSIWSFQTAEKISESIPSFTNETEQRLPKIYLNTHSISVVDFDNDGDFDICEVDNNPSLNKPSVYLYRNNGNGSFFIANPEGLPKNLKGLGSTWSDFDNDGDFDVMIWFSDHHPILYRNDRNLNFVDVTSIAGISFNPEVKPSFNSCSWCDIDNDGDMDLYCSFGEKLFKNNGDQSFIDITAESGISPINEQYPRACAWFDYNKDGLMDLLTAGNNAAMYTNKGENKFKKDSIPGGYNPYDHWGIAIGDFNNDGFADIFLTGNGTTCDKLLKNNGKGAYEDIIKQSGFPQGLISNYSATWVDVDNDGWLDLAADKKIFHNNGNDQFTEITGSVGIQHIDSVNSIVSFDANKDGAQDIMFGTLNQNQLYINEKPGNNWLKIKLIGNQLNQHGYGTEIRVKSENEQWFRYTLNKVGRYDQESPVQHFGVGQSNQVDIRVVWPNSIVDELFDIDVNTIIEINEGHFQDKIAPAKITNLVSTSESYSSVVLGWTATGDDYWIRDASCYQIRWSNSPINDLNWDSAMSLSSVPKPAKSGASQHVTIKDLLPDTTYYFAIKASDESGNTSNLSNVASIHTSLGKKLLNLTALPGGCNSIDLKWKIPDLLISKYKIWYSTSSFIKNDLKNADQLINPPEPGYPGDIQVISITDLKPNTKYYFTIEMIYKKEVSSFSDVIFAKTNSLIRNSLSEISSMKYQFHETHGCFPFIQGDINGDHLPDLVITSSSYINESFRYNVSVHLSDHGNINPIPMAKFSNNFFHYASIQSTAISDLNNDGKDDLIIAQSKDSQTNNHTGKVKIYFGGDQIAPNPNYCIDGNSSESRLKSAVLGGYDFNNDQIEDLVIYEKEIISFYYGKDNNFDTQKDNQLALNGPRTNTVYLSAGDFNGDHQNDIVAKYNNNLAFFISKNGNLNTSPKIFTLEKNSFSMYAPAIGDFNSDGYDDIAVSISNEVYVYFGSSNDKWPEEIQSLKFNDKMQGNSNLISMDINNDGKDDLLYSNYDDNTYYDGTITIFLGNSNFDTIADMEVSMEGYPDFGKYIQSFGDLNQDGYNDLFIGSNNERMLVMAGQSMNIKSETTPPSKVNDLSAQSLIHGQVILNWTAPHDNEVPHKAYQYEIIQTCSYYGFAKNWGSSSESVLNIPIPSKSGTHEKLLINNLIPGLTYKFKLRSWDTNGNLSNESNTASIEVFSGFEQSKKFEFDKVDSTSMNCNNYSYSLGSLYNGGDLNGDGIDDILLNGGAQCGRLRIFWGGGSFDSSPDFDIIGNDQLGKSLEYGSNCYVNRIDKVFPLGDYNNDGKSDFYIFHWCFNKEGFYNGSQNLYNVTPDGKLSLEWDAIENVGDVNGDHYDDFIAIDNLYEMSKPTRLGLFLGHSSFKETPDLILFNDLKFNQVRGIGDVNGDGFSDIAVSKTDSNNHSSVLIFLGNQHIDNKVDITLNPLDEQYAFSFAKSIEGIGDWNGDGFNDLAVSNYSTQINNDVQGVVYLYFGKKNISDEPDMIIKGPAGGTYFGQELYSAGDLNGDGCSDFIVGGLQGSTYSGQTRIVYLGSKSSINKAAHSINEYHDNGIDKFLNREHPLSIDFNGDGKSEIIWKGYKSNQFPYYLVELVEKDSDNDGISDIDDPFPYHKTPAKPQLLTPGDEMTDVNNNGIFSWTSENANHLSITYNLYVGKSTEPELIKSDIIDNQYQMSKCSLDYNTYYYWKAAAKDNVGQVVYSDTQSFITDMLTTPSQPEYITITAQSTGNLLEWSLNSNQDIEQVIIQRKKTEETEWELAAQIGSNVKSHLDSYLIEPHQSYDYRIAFENMFGPGNFSSSQSVVVANHPPVLLINQEDYIFRTTENNTILFSGSDPDDDSLSYSLTSYPDGMSINIEQNIIEWVPEKSQTGEYTIVLNVYDQYQGTDQKQIHVNVRNKPFAEPKVICGTIRYFDGISIVPNTTVVLENSRGDEITSTLSDSNGRYTITVLESDGYELRAYMYNDIDSYGAGYVKALEILEIITEKRGKSFYDIIAGDCDIDGELTVKDALEMIYHAVRLDPSYKYYKWKIFSSDYQLTEEYFLNEEGYVRRYINLQNSLYKQDFIAFKNGDVGHSWKPINERFNISINSDSNSLSINFNYAYVNPCYTMESNHSITDSTIQVNIQLKGQGCEQEVTEIKISEEIGVLSPGAYSCVVFINNVRYGEKEFEVKEIKEQITSLTPGWNMISYYISPQNREMGYLLKPIIDNKVLQTILDEDGNIIYSAQSGWINGEQMSNKKGYLLKSNQEIRFSNKGEEVELPFEIQLKQGWSIIGYPVEKPQNIYDVMKPLIDNNLLDKVIDEKGNRLIYLGITEEWLNQIGDIVPGKGYLINVLENCSLKLKQ